MNSKARLISLKSLIRPSLAAIGHALSLIAFSLAMARLLDAITQQDYAGVGRWLGLAAGLLVAQMAAYFWHVFSDNRWIRTQNAHTKRLVVEGWNRKDYETFTAETVTDHASFFVKELDVLDQQYYRSILSLVASIPTLALALISLWLIHPVFIGLLVLMIVSSAIVTIVFSNRMEQANTSFLDRVKELNFSVDELCRGFGIVKIFSLQKVILEKIRGLIQAQEEAGEKRQNLAVTANGLIMFATLLAHLIGYGLGAWLILRGSVTVGLMIASIELVGYAFEPIVEITGAITQIKGCRSVVERVKQLADYPSSDTQRSKEYSPLPLTIQDLSFAYPGANETILQGLSCQLEPGKTYAVTGKNGTGKSTLLRILSGLYDRYDGQLSVNGHHRTSICKDDWFQKVAYIPQDLFLFQGGVYENTGAPISPQAEELIDAFWMDYAKDRVWDNAMSGGEKQKLSIIRALLKDADLILADEPTSQLDAKTRDVFYRYMKQTGKTWVVITHDAEELVHFDEVLDLGNRDKTIQYALI